MIWRKPEEAALFFSYTIGEVVDMVISLFSCRGRSLVQGLPRDLRNKAPMVASLEYYLHTSI